MLGAKSLLEEWNKGVEGQEVCAVCGDGVPWTILQVHHLHPYKKRGWCG